MYEEEDGSWASALGISNLDNPINVHAPTKEAAKEYADKKLSETHACGPQCGNWEIFTGSNFDVMKFGP